MSFLSLKNTEIEEIISNNPLRGKTFEYSADLIREFVERIYSKCEEDFANSKIAAAELYNLAVSLLLMLDLKKHDELFKMEVFNPSVDTHGTELSYTIVQLVLPKMPFLIDTIVNAIVKSRVNIEYTLTAEVPIKRNAEGKLLDMLLGRYSNIETDPELKDELVIQLFLKKITKAEKLEELKKEIVQAIEYNRLVVADHQAMREKTVEMQRKLIELCKLDRSCTNAEVVELDDFMVWLTNKGFVFLGFSEYDLNYDIYNKPTLVLNPDSQLGICRTFAEEKLYADAEAVRYYIEHPYWFAVVKSLHNSPVHRTNKMDLIVLQAFDLKTEHIVKEYRLFGLFTSNFYYDSVMDTPLHFKIEHALAKIKENSGFYFNEKEILVLLENYSRDELISIEEDELVNNIIKIYDLLKSKRGSKIVTHTDLFGRFVSFTIYVIRDILSDTLISNVEGLVAHFCHTSSFINSSYYIDSSGLARINIMVDSKDLQLNCSELAMLEHELAMISSVYFDDLLTKLKADCGEEEGERLFEKYKRGLSQSYIESFTAGSAVWDLRRSETLLSKKEGLYFDIYYNKNTENDELRILNIKIYSLNQDVVLSRILPILENYSFNIIDENTYKIKPANSTQEISVYHLQSLLNTNQRNIDNIAVVKGNFAESILNIWLGEAENDLLNSLILISYLNSREINVLRIYIRYLKQVNLSYSFNNIAKVIVRYPDLATVLVNYFETKFSEDPEVAANRDSHLQIIQQEIHRQFSLINNSLDDEIFHKIFEAIEATVRTNYFLNYNYFAIKVQPKGLSEIALPVPMAEIFVYSNLVEAIHLRAGKVARGGIRWSDRPEDYRTEILSLMKTQTAKNAVIVPVGSKGGFILKRSTDGMDRAAVQREARNCYRIFMKGLLDLTDNVVDGEIVKPAGVVCYDGNDPYLVVAADKGTASFADLANQVAAEYKFWLGDAFAAGGSVGYDHKEMGITARGAWISVARHFNMDFAFDVQDKDFTVVGIGDMSGDVFGNGMLRSEHIRLVAAFNHMHIFVDPEPDAVTSFRERQRLFKLSGSTWADYDPELISKGGGVFLRKDKEIELTPEMKRALAINTHARSITPNELIKAILKAKVDLLWNGGIGTYVKSSAESNMTAADKNNDAVRINGNELRCKVVGEGGNLGFTQLGRIEAAQAGIKLNTDALDNSAGVDCSDHEVNIKIAFAKAIEAGKCTLDERNLLMKQMRDAVAELVLADNHAQSLGIKITARRSFQFVEAHANLMEVLEEDGLLNRKVESLPDQDELNMRIHKHYGLTSPELCVLMAYSKIYLYNFLLNSEILSDNYYEHYLFDYFPTAIQDKLKNEILHHQLRKEIVATVLINQIVNRMGCSFVNRMSVETGASIDQIIKFFVVAWHLFGLESAWKELESGAEQMGANIQIDLFIEIRQLVEKTIKWLLYKNPKGTIKELIKQYQAPVKMMEDLFEDLAHSGIVEIYKERLQFYEQLKISQTLARKISGIQILAAVFDIYEISTKTKVNFAEIGKLYIAVNQYFKLGHIQQSINNWPTGDYWKRIMLVGLQERLQKLHVMLVAKVVELGAKAVLNEKGNYELSNLAEWLTLRKTKINKYLSLNEKIYSEREITTAMIVVLLDRLERII